jgi:hypothetical protein
VTTARWFIERLVRPPVVLVGSTIERVYDFFFRERDIRASREEEERRKKSHIEGFPEGFRVQRIGIAATKSISELPASEIAKYFREHPEIAGGLLGESYDKRFTPSSFMEQKGNGFRVGWFTRDAKYECVQEFSTLADAATDYLLFSLGKRRWTPQE